MWHRLQPYVAQAATLSARGCNLTSPYIGWMQEWEQKHPSRTRAAALRPTAQGHPTEGAQGGREPEGGSTLRRRVEPEEPIVAYVRALGEHMYDATADRCLVYTPP